MEIFCIAPLVPSCCHAPCSSNFSQTDWKSLVKRRKQKHAFEITWRRWLTPPSHIRAHPCPVSELSTSTQPPICLASLSCGRELEMKFAKVTQRKRNLVTFPWLVQRRGWGCTHRDTSPLHLPPQPSNPNLPNPSHPIEICWMAMPAVGMWFMTEANLALVVLAWSSHMVGMMKNAAARVNTTTRAQVPANVEETIVNNDWNAINKI